MACNEYWDSRQVSGVQSHYMVTRILCKRSQRSKWKNHSYDIETMNKKEFSFNLHSSSFHYYNISLNRSKSDMSTVAYTFRPLNVCCKYISISWIYIGQIVKFTANDQRIGLILKRRKNIDFRTDRWQWTPTPPPILMLNIWMCDQPRRIYDVIQAKTGNFDHNIQIRSSLQPFMIFWTQINGFRINFPPNILKLMRALVGSANAQCCLDRLSNRFFGLISVFWSWSQNKLWIVVFTCEEAAGQRIILSINVSKR